MQTCCLDGCHGRVVARGWCRKHYSRWHRYGDPLAAAFVRIDGTPEERWWAKVDKQPGDGCWLWTGGVDRHGYGQFDVINADGHKNHRAHRWGYQHFVRPLDDNETLDHLCRVHACVRFDHLEPVSLAENIARGEAGKHNATKTHCPRGHAYDSVNDRGRFCSVCVREQHREAQRRLRGYQGNLPNADKTHCKNGHEFTVENTIVRASGRQCRECARAATREYMRRKRAAPA